MRMIDLFDDGEYFISVFRIVEIHIEKCNKDRCIDNCEYNAKFDVKIDVDGLLYSFIKCYKTLDEAKAAALRIAEECE